MPGLEISTDKIGFVIVKAREMAATAQRVGDLDRARTAADDDGRVDPGREGRAQLRHRFAARNRRAWTWSMRYITRG